MYVSRRGGLQRDLPSSAENAIMSSVPHQFNRLTGACVSAGFFMRMRPSAQTKGPVKQSFKKPSSRSARVMHKGAATGQFYYRVFCTVVLHPLPRPMAQCNSQTPTL